MNRVVLIDCENLSAPAQRRMAALWLGWERVELFGREAFMAPWRATLAGLGLAVQAETLVADDAPSQAADEIMAARAAELATSRPNQLVIASNDKGFDAGLAEIKASGVPASRRGDLSAPEALRLVVDILGGGDWVPAGGIGDHLARKFGLRLKGRAEDWAKAAGLELTRGPGGPRLRPPPSP